MKNIEEKIYKILSLELHPLNRDLTVELSYYLFLILNREKQTIEHIGLDFTDFINYMHDKFGSDTSYLQDFIPEADDGEIKYFYKGQSCRIFYGTGLEDTYDWLQQFEIIYSSVESIFEEALKISPMKFFFLALCLQDHALDTLVQNKEYVSNLSKNIELNQLFLPIKADWFESLKDTLLFKESDLKFILKEMGFNPEEENLFFNNFVAETRSNTAFNANTSTFIKKLWSGQVDNYWFIKIKDLYYLRPKKISEALINNFFKLFKQNLYDQEILTKIKKELIVQLADRIYRNIDNTKVIIQNQIKDETGIEYNSDLLLVADGFYFIPINITVPLKETEVDLTSEIERLTINSDFINPTIIGFDRKTLKGTKGEYSVNIQKEKVSPILIMLTMDFRNYTIFPNKPGTNINIISLSDFLGFIEEIDNNVSLVKFLQQYNSLRKNTTLSPYSTLCEVFSIFKSQNNCLSFGGKAYNYMVIMPHSWSGYRYDSLRKKWANLIKFKEGEKPFMWKFDSINNSTYIAHIPNTNLISKVLIIKNKIYMWFTVNTKYFKEKELSINKLIADMLIYYFSKIEDFLYENLKQYKYLHFYFYSNRVLREYQKDFNDILNYVSLKDLEKPYSFISNNMNSFIEFGIIFNKEKFTALFNGTQSDNGNEIFFVKTLLESLGVKVPDNLFTSFAGKPRNVIKPINFPIVLKETPGEPIFPTREDECNADNLTFKACYENKVKPGRYFSEDAKNIINSVVEYLEKILSDQINKYNKEELLYSLLLEIEKLEYRRFYTKAQTKLGISTYIEYDPVESFEKTMNKVLKSVKAATYLFEFTLKNHNNSSHISTITNLELSELIAIGDEICSLYLVSDNVYYKLWSNYGVEVTGQYKIQPIEEEPKGYRRLFRKNVSQQLFGKKDFKISNEENEKYLEDINEAFENDLNFKFTTLLQVLGALYSRECDRERLKLIQIFSNINEVAEEIKKCVKVDISDIKMILEFLTLKKENIKDYIPTRRANNEYKLRTKPLIEMGDKKIIFGRFSVYKTLILWEQYIHEGLFPYSISGNKTYSKINAVIQERKSSLDRELENFVFEFLKSKSSWDVCEKNLDFHSRFGESFPDLGDYDAFCISLLKREIVLVEVKNLRTPFMPNEIKREFKSLFHKESSGRRIDYSTKFMKRVRFVENNLVQSLNLFNVKTIDKSWKVKNYFVMRNLSYNLFSVPSEFESIEFINLQDFIKEINF